MADRCTLHWNHLPAFSAWLESEGWHIVATPPGSGFEVLRARHPNQQHPVIFYARLAKGKDAAPASAAIHVPEASAKSLFSLGGDITHLAQHLTSFGRGPVLVRRFLRSRRAPRHAVAAVGATS